MATTRRLKELTRAGLDKLMLPPGPVTVALSGGADSAALAFLCIEAAVASSALHIDHGFPASARLSDAADSVAKRLSLPMETVTVEVGDGPSPEERARQARYAVFDQRDTAVLTAHTRDDNAETMLINLIRGTGAVGLAGIPYHRPPVTFRPILSLSRSDTRELATLADLPFFDDPMNEDPSLTRTRVRREILPLLREINPQVVESMARAGVALDRDSSFLDSLVPAAGEADGVPAAIARTLPRPVADRVLQRLLHSAGVGVTSDRMERVWSVVNGEADGQELTGGRRVERRGALVVIV